MTIEVMRFLRSSESPHLVIAMLVRCLLLVYGNYHDSHNSVPYTDIDYHVVTDAARYVSEGQSPFERPTYRYTPLLAWLLLPNIYLHPSWGKIIFCMLDCIAGYLIYSIVRLKQSKETSILSSLFWLYNPLLIAISTRGSSESVMAFLVLLVIYFHRIGEVILTGLSLGFAIHFKLYPIIYSVPLYISLEERTPDFTWSWFRPTVARLKLTLATLAAFVALSSAAYHLYGYEYLNESFLYHVSRVDTRHNFSVFFYLLYLTVDQPIPGLSIVTFAPQMILVAIYGCAYGDKKHVIVAMFAQTFAFVTFNKVVTSQYFIWYLVFLPLLANSLNLSLKKSLVLITLWILAQAAWLLPAYLLEFHSSNVFMPIWLESIAFFCCNVGVLTAVLASYWSNQKFNGTDKPKFH